MAKRNAAPSKASTALNKRQNTGNRKVKPPKKPSVSPPATTKTTKADDVAEPIKLLLSMDYGTKTLSVAYRFVKPGEDATLANVPNVHFSEKEYYAPQKVAWAEDGTFYWGHGIDRAEKTKAIKTDQVIELFKLCLYEVRSYRVFPQEPAPRHICFDASALFTTMTLRLIKVHRSTKLPTWHCAWRTSLEVALCEN